VPSSNTGKWLKGREEIQVRVLALKITTTASEMVDPWSYSTKATKEIQER
jgi:hypothetical protein